MDETLVERVTGRPAEVPEPVAVNVVMSDQTLLGDDNSPATIEGYGPIPASVARKLISGAVADAPLGGDFAAVVPSPQEWVAVGNGVAVSAFPTRLGDLHRVARSNLSHTIL